MKIIKKKEINHTDLNTSINLFYTETKKFICLPDMDQTKGIWNDNRKNPLKCCFGARIAKAFVREMSIIKKILFGVEKEFF